jgi:hypothetical protein
MYHSRCGYYRSLISIDMAKQNSTEKEATEQTFRLNLATVPYSRTQKRVPDVCGWMTPLGLFSRTNKTFKANGREIGPPNSDTLKALYDSYPELRNDILAPEGYEPPA